MIKTSELLQLTGGKVLSFSESERELSGVYICDLLSLAMAKIKEGDVWITIQSNMNVVAVAALTDAGCVIVAEGIEVSEELVNAAIQKDVQIITSELSAYEIAKRLSPVL